MTKLMTKRSRGQQELTEVQVKWKKGPHDRRALACGVGRSGRGREPGRLPHGAELLLEQSPQLG